MYKIKELSYGYADLEPYIDTETMKLHYDKHYKIYVENFNNLIRDNIQLQKIPLEDLLKDLSLIPFENKQNIINNLGGVYNHEMFWNMMSPNKYQKPIDFLLKEIDIAFDGYENFQELFSREAKSCFGSGWVWLNLNKNKKLFISKSANQESPFSEGAIPIMGLDLWEHAYYLKYQNRRFDYISAWWNVVNWRKIEDLYQKAMKD